MIQLKRLDAFTPEQIDMLPETGRDKVLASARFMYEAVGEVPYGIVGIVSMGMLSREAVIWFLPYEGIRPSWQERRAAKEFNLTKAIGFTPLADIHVDNVAARKFAEFFGLRKLTTEGDYHRYVGES
jgi:hypothetical protein